MTNYLHPFHPLIITDVLTHYAFCVWNALWMTALQTFLDVMNLQYWLMVIFFLFDVLMQNVYLSQVPKLYLRSLIQLSLILLCWDIKFGSSDTKRDSFWVCLSRTLLRKFVEILKWGCPKFINCFAVNTLFRNKEKYLGPGETWCSIYIHLVLVLFGFFKSSLSIKR